MAGDGLGLVIGMLAHPANWPEKPAMQKAATGTASTGSICEIEYYATAGVPMRRVAKMEQRPQPLGTCPSARRRASQHGTFCAK